jgi:hypothetical protein
MTKNSRISASGLGATGWMVPDEKQKTQARLGLVRAKKNSYCCRVTHR